MDAGAAGRMTNRRDSWSIFLNQYLLVLTRCRSRSHPIHALTQLLACGRASCMKSPARGEPRRARFRCALDSLRALILSEVDRVGSTLIRLSRRPDDRKLPAKICKLKKQRSSCLSLALPPSMASRTTRLPLGCASSTSRSPIPPCSRRVLRPFWLCAGVWPRRLGWGCCSASCLPRSLNRRSCRPSQSRNCFGRSPWCSSSPPCRQRLPAAWDMNCRGDRSSSWPSRGPIRSPDCSATDLWPSGFHTAPAICSVSRAPRGSSTEFGKREISRGFLRWCRVGDQSSSASCCSSCSWA